MTMPGVESVHDAADPTELARWLLRAVDVLAARWPEDGYPGIDQRQAVALAMAARSFVIRTLEGTTVEPSELPMGMLAWVVLDHLEDAWFRVADQSPEVTIAQTADVARAISRLRAAAQRDASQQFGRRLGGGDALQLVVELAHDLRSPLGSVMFLSDHLRSGGAGPVTPQQARQLALIYSATFALSGVVNDVVEFARGGSRLLEPAPVPFDLGEVVRRVHDLVRPAAEEKGLTLATPDEYPGARFGHPVALERVLLNLMSNAVKFTEQGGVSIEIQAVSPRDIRCTVRDTGRGIQETDLRMLRQPFRPFGERSGSGFSAAGLGLAMCHRLLGFMGSALQVESTPGLGTAFWFEVSMPTTADALGQ